MNMHRKSMGALQRAAFVLMLSGIAQGSAAAQGASDQDSGVPIWVYGVTVLFAGLTIWVGWLAWKSWSGARASRSWPTAQGTLLAAQMGSYTEYDSNTSTDNVFYQPQVRYAYEVRGRRYEGERIRFGRFRESKKGAQAILDRYTVGSAVEVRYDPVDPSNATLETGSGGIGMIIFAAAGCLIGTIFMLWLILHWQ